MQWFGIGRCWPRTPPLVAAVLHLLVGWPGPVGAVAAAATVAVPAGLVAGTSAQLAPLAGRVLVHVLSLAGFSIVVSVIYLVIVLGLGHAPGDHGDREVLGAVHARRGGGRGRLRARPGAARSRPPPGSSTGPGRRPTRCCAPSAAG